MSFRESKMRKSKLAPFCPSGANSNQSQIHGWLTLMIKHVCLARFGRVTIRLLAISHREMRVAGSDSKILCGEIAFRFPVMKSGFFVMMRGIVMKTGRRMLARHFVSPTVDMKL